MKLLKHPILSGLGFEAALIATFLVFPVGPCNAPAPGIAVLALHTPGFLLSSLVLGATSDKQSLIIAPIVMTAVWISSLYLLRRVFNPEDATSLPLNNDDPRP